MAKKRKDRLADDLWIAPRCNLKGPAGDRAWDTGPGVVPQNSRFLELADIALGLKKPEPKKPKRKLVHDTVKREPCSG